MSYMSNYGIELMYTFAFHSALQMSPSAWVVFRTPTDAGTLQFQKGCVFGRLDTPKLKKDNVEIFQDREESEWLNISERTLPFARSADAFISMDFARPVARWTLARDDSLVKRKTDEDSMTGMTGHFVLSKTVVFQDFPSFLG